MEKGNEGESYVDKKVSIAVPAKSKTKETSFKSKGIPLQYTETSKIKSQFEYF